MYFTQPTQGAYAAIEPALLSPKQAEAKAIATLTRQLIAAYSDARVPFIHKVELLHKNRALWQSIMMVAADDENELDAPLRASLISLGAFVDRITGQLLRGEGDIRLLLEINRRIVAGLSSGGA